jgi:hypothetical protein
MFRLYLDDERQAPEHFNIRCYTAANAIKVLSSGIPIDVVSLDHDLGDDKAGTGYDVLLWIEEQVHTNPYYELPLLHIHTANPSARLKMQAACDNIVLYYISYKKRRANESY